MEKKDDSTKIDLGDLLKEYQESDPSTLQNYLAEIWVDLARRSKDPIKGIEKLTFRNYFELPGIIADRLFAVFDRDCNGFLDHGEFIYSMKILFAQGETFQTLAKFIFRFYDFDKNGKIDREDVRVVLSYVPLNKKKDQKSKVKTAITEDFKDRVESQSQLVDILNTAFGDKKELNLNDYTQVIENVNSDIFILILQFLLESKPFSKETIRIFALNEKLTAEQKAMRTPKLISQKIASPSVTNRFISPTLKKKTLANNPAKNILSLYAGTTDGGEQLKKQGFKRDQKKSEFSLKLKALREEEKPELNPEQNIPLRRRRIDLSQLEDKTPQLAPFTFSKYEDDKIIKEEPKEEKTNDEKDLDKDENQKPLIKYEGYMLKMTHSNKLKKVYFRLVGRDIYYFKNNTDTEHKGMHNLSGIYVKDTGKVTVKDKQYFTFSILYPQKARTYYFDEEIDYKTWLDKLRLAVEYKSLLEKYNVKGKLGKGKFGLVKYAIQKETNMPVAVKIMAKKDMDNSDLELAKDEIDILKISQHPNIVKIYDVFDTIDYIYIVMEYCGGGDLFSYIEKTHYKLPEPRVCEIIHKLSMAIYYIHSYGIVHRDLKPENILMTDDSDKADIRLVDFGLSKIVGPGQKCKEPYGTLSFVAPEVLRGKEYDKSVDLWSLGITTYLLLCGFLPFDDKHSEREIARQTIEEPTPFPSKTWNHISSEAKAFVDGLLKKKPEERLSIIQVLEHPWIKKFSKIPDKRMHGNILKHSTFEAYAAADPEQL